MARSVKASGDAAAATGGFTPLPAGEYIMTITDVKKSTVGKSGENEKTPALDIEFKIAESGTGTGVGRKFISFRQIDVPAFASGKSGFMFYQFYKALGVEFPKEGEDAEVELPDLQELLGEEVGVRLSKEPADEYNENGSNRIKAYFPASKGLKVATVDKEEFVL